MASLQVSREGIFRRFRTPDTARPTSPGLFFSHTPSPSTASVGSSVGELAQENDLLRTRCEELTLQSWLNQELFEQCSQNLLTKEAEVKDLHDQVAKYEELIASLKEHVKESDRKDDHIKSLESKTHTLGLQIEKASTEKDALIHNHKVEINNLQEQLQRAHIDSVFCSNQYVKQCSSINALYTQRDSMQIELESKQNLNANLELQLDHLATQVAGAMSVAHEREKLILELNIQLQQIIECYAKETQAHAEQKQSLDGLYQINKKDQERFKARFEAQESVIALLQEQLSEAETEVDKVVVARDDEVADLTEKLRRTALNLQYEAAKNKDWI